MRAEIDAICKVSDVYGRHRAIAGEVFWRFSIDLLKFFIALVSSFSICMCFLNTKNLKDFGIVNANLIQNLYFFTLSIISPLLFYYFINNSISYNIIYLTIGFFFVVSLASTFYVKDK